MLLPGLNLYADLKRLTAEGLAAATIGSTGRRKRTTYAITDDGRTALRHWLASPGAGPQFECEALVKLGFAPYTSKEAALAQVAVLADHAADRLALGRALAAEHSATDGPLPERLHINSVMWRYLWDQHTATARWAEWARAEIESWPDTSDSPALRERGRQTLRDAVQPDDPRA